jgi:hypothetical protein
MHAAHEIATYHGAEVLRLQSALDSQATMYADVSRHKVEEASWFVLRAELTCWAEPTRRLEAAHGRTMPELSALRECHMVIEVFVKRTMPLSAARPLRTSYKKSSCALRRE